MVALALNVRTIDMIFIFVLAKNERNIHISKKCAKRNPIHSGRAIGGVPRAVVVEQDVTTPRGDFLMKWGEGGYPASPHAFSIERGNAGQEIT